MRQKVSSAYLLVEGYIDSVASFISVSFGGRIYWLCSHFECRDTLEITSFTGFPVKYLWNLNIKKKKITNRVHFKVQQNQILKMLLTEIYTELSRNWKTGWIENFERLNFLHKSRFLKIHLSENLLSFLVWQDKHSVKIFLR